MASDSDRPFLAGLRRFGAGMCRIELAEWRMCGAACPPRRVKERGRTGPAMAVRRMGESGAALAAGEQPRGVGAACEAAGRCRRTAVCRTITAVLTSNMDLYGSLLLVSN
ncbi:hypothetical protein C8J57DRAFT_1223212 [Mycena rebaudengoi]|nr:hypothetical protein C8J57DRAFT_1223212 [Mycena rebaudengoi]